MSPEPATQTESRSDTEDDTPIDMSKMSEGKRAAMELAESSRESSWESDSFVGEIFLGRLPWHLIHPFPDQAAEDKEKGDRFLETLEKFLREKVNPDTIDQEGEIPQDLIDELGSMGAFGIKIPEAYGGLGLSQVNYSRAAMILGSYCGNLTALLSAHQSIGIPQPLKLFGTEEQKKLFLPRVAGGEISAFALTEEGVGSDPAKMETRADPTPDGKHFVINGEKLWCTNGTKAGLLVVMAKTPPKILDGREKNQISAFIVPTDTPGVTIEHRCRFMGLRSLYNGVISFKDVKVPREYIILAEGKGLKVALTTLNTGRLTLPAACVGLAKRCLEVNRKWCSERVQWGAPIGHHGAIADKLAKMTSELFAVEAMTLLTSNLVDRGGVDIRLEAAMCKMMGTEMGWKIVDETMQIRGGRGYETKQSQDMRGEEGVAVERFMRDARINLIFEGSSEIMRLFIAREALDPHLKKAGAVMHPKLKLAEKIKAGCRALTFYATWYPSQWLPSRSLDLSSLDPVLAHHVHYASDTSRVFARRFFHQMAKHGPKLEREQVLLSRFVEIGTDLFAISACCSRAQSLIEKEVENREEVLGLADYFCKEARLRIARRFQNVKRNNDRDGYRLARKILDGKYRWMEKGVVNLG